MKILLKELSEVNQSLLKMLSKEMDVKLAYRMRKISGKIVAELKHIENAISELRKKYGEKEKNAEGKETGQITVPQKNMSDFEKEVEVLLALEVNLGAELIPYDCIEGMGKISPLDLANIEKFVEEPKGAKDVRKPNQPGPK